MMLCIAVLDFCGNMLWRTPYDYWVFAITYLKIGFPESIPFLVEIL
jgi:hypothetical protein